MGATGRRCHAKETIQNVAEAVQIVWAYEDRQVSLQPASAILVRIMIGKVADGTRLREAFANTPIRQGMKDTRVGTAFLGLKRLLVWLFSMARR